MHNRKTCDYSPSQARHRAKIAEKKQKQLADVSTLGVSISQPFDNVDIVNRMAARNESLKSRLEVATKALVTERTENREPKKRNRAQQRVIDELVQEIPPRRDGHCLRHDLLTN